MSGLHRLRIVAILLGGSLIIGEAYRSWGAGRTPTAWLDDMLMGTLLICAAIAVARGGWQRRALFTGAWGVCAGMLYGSFFGKVFDPARANPGNFSLGTLTALVGVAFAVSVLGFVASLFVAHAAPPNDDIAGPPPMPMTDDQLRDTMNARMSPSARLLGMNILEVDSKAGRVLMTFEPRPEFCNPMGSVQGGFVTAMLDDAAAYAAIIHSGERIAVPTIELKVSFFGPARAGKPLRVEGRCIKLGKRVAFMEADMFDENGKVLARLSTSASPMKMGEANLVPPTAAATSGAGEAQ